MKIRQGNRLERNKHGKEKGLKREKNTEGGDEMKREHK